MSILSELWDYMRSRKKFWILPLLVTMLVIGGLLIVAKSSAIAPFIYTLF